MQYSPSREVLMSWLLMESQMTVIVERERNMKSQVEKVRKKGKNSLS